MDRDVLQREVLARWEIASTAVEDALTQHLVLAFLGSASAGKDSAIRAMFGIDFGQIDPIPGSTERIRVSPLDASRRVMIVNAPGFGDIRSRVDTEARKVLERLDIAVYVVNSDGGATIDERRDLDAIRELGKPTLVVLNKIDLIREHEREEFVTRTLLQLGTERHDAVVAAFDPHPALAEAPIGVDRVIDWIHTHLDRNGKALVFAKNLKNKAAACEPLIRSAAKKAAVAGGIPIPGADITAVTAIQVKLITDIAAIHGQKIDKDLVLFILAEALAGGSKGFVRWAVEAAKTAGWVPGGQLAHVATSALGATVSSAATYGVGKAAVSFMQSQGQANGPQLKLAFDAAAFEYRDVKQIPGPADEAE